MRSAERPRLLNTRRVLAATGAGLALAACTPTVEGGANSPAQSPSITTTPRATETPPLSDPKSCLGSEGGTIAVAPDRFIIAQNGQEEIIICDLTGNGLPSQADALADILAQANCIPDDSKPPEYFAYPDEPPVTYRVPVEDSNCVNNISGVRVDIQPPTTTI